MKTFFVVKQNDDTESYSGRFDISNDELNISTQSYDLIDAINKFLSTFKEEYHYWQNICDKDLNKVALIEKNKFMGYEQTYEKYSK